MFDFENLSPTASSRALLRRRYALSAVLLMRVEVMSFSSLRTCAR
ncbi:MAG: hypothetical protein ABF792_05830 [Bifidobacterium psychraerophilum]